jgi:hypothetical protein
MNSHSVVTLTLGDQAENHAGMEQLGQMVDVGQGFQLEDLEEIKVKLESIGIICELLRLDLYEDINKIDVSVSAPENAYLLIVRNGVNKLLETCSTYTQGCSTYTQGELFGEHIRLNVDKQAWMKGKVVNKHARWNLCFDNESRDPDYENKKGRIIGYDEVPITKKLLEIIPDFFGEKSRNLKGEGNYYYDKSKCGIGFHGDSERRKVIGIRLGWGESMPLHFQWFHNGESVGERIIIPLNGGDMYVMSEKAVGTDWKRKKIHTLRHATGSSHFTAI